MNKGQILHTPKLSSAIIGDWEEAITKGTIDKDTNFDATPEKTPCDKCNGSGHRWDIAEKCQACEATGISHILNYGIEDGVVYANLEVFGVDFRKETCKAFREAETPETRRKSMALRPFLMFDFLRMELTAAGFDVDACMNGADSDQLRSMSNYISQNYPEFLTTNLRKF